MASSRTIRTHLDLSSLNLEVRKKIAKFATKKQAADFAASCGWRRYDVTEAATRLQAFWIVGQVIADDFRSVTWDRKTVDFAYPGRK